MNKQRADRMNKQRLGGIILAAILAGAILATSPLYAAMAQVLITDMLLAYLLR